MMQNKKILYLSVNCSYSHSSLAYGQLCSYAKLKAPDWEWSKQEYTTKDNISEILSNILYEKPGLLISTVYLFNKNYIFELIKKIKLLLPGTKIILGGPEFLGSNEKTLKNNLEIDAVFRGDETSFYRYLHYLNIKQQDIPIIPGLCYIDKDKNYIDNGSSFTDRKNLDFLPSPYDISIIPKNKPFMQLETSRGCFSNCSFCTSSLSKHVAYYSIERVKADLKQIRKSGYNEVRILDRTFNLPVKRACNLLNLFIKEFPDIRFHLELEPEKLSTEIINILQIASHGQFHIEAGIQTFQPLSLKAVNRFGNIEKTKRNLSKLVSLKNIDVHADLIFGLPEQTTDSVYNDINTLIQISPTEIQLEILKVLPGTPIADIDKSILVSSPVPPYEVLKTSNITSQELLQLSYLSKLIDSFYNIKDFQPLMLFATTSNPEFLKEFLNFSKKALMKPEKPSIKNRLSLFYNYAESINDQLLKELVIFTSFKAGIFAPQYENFTVLKKVEANKILKENNLISIFNNSAQLLEKPVYYTEFQYNAGQIWKEPKKPVIKQRHIYIFRLSQTGLSKKVSRIDYISTEK